MTVIIFNIPKKGRSSSTVVMNNLIHAIADDKIISRELKFH